MKSECSEHQKKIAASFLGDLTKEEKQALEVHLATCSLCRSEQESYAHTIQQLAVAGEEDVPHHFFIYPEKQSFNPWQAVLATAAALILLFGTATVSRLQIRSNPSGWSISFGRSDLDPTALKEEILKAAERKNQESRAAWIREMQTEIARSHDSLTQQEALQLTSALARMDSRITGRIADSEGHVRNDTQKLVSDMYRTVAQQRAQDLEGINLRFDSTEASNAIQSRRTNEVLGTLLEVADLKLR
jgi:hypothetical protein